MANSLRPIWHMAGAVCVAGALWVAPAKATESTGVVAEAAALAAAAVTTDVVTTAAVTTAGVSGAEVLDADGTGARFDVPDKIARANADATMTPALRPAKHSAAAASRSRRVAFTRPGPSCSGVWCGRHYVLMLGVAY